MELREAEVITRFSEDGKVIPVRIREYNLKKVMYEAYDIEKVYYMEDLGKIRKYSVKGKYGDFILEFSEKDGIWRKSSNS